MAKEGSTIGGLMDCFGTAVSMSLQYGVPLEVYVNKFSHTRFEPMGHTKNPDIRIAKSIVDYIFRWLGITFLPGYREANAGHSPTSRRRKLGRWTPKQSIGPPPRRPAGRPWPRSQATCNGCRSRRSRSDRQAVERPPEWPPRQTGRPTRSLLERAGVAMKVDLNGGTLPSGPSNSPASRPMPPVATTAARSPSATAIATSATTAATAWAARNGLSGWMPASNPL